MVSEPTQQKNCEEPKHNRCSAFKKPYASVPSDVTHIHPNKGIGETFIGGGSGSSLVVQQLRCCFAVQRLQVPSLVRELSCHISQGTVKKLKIKKKKQVAQRICSLSFTSDPQNSSKFDDYFGNLPWLIFHNFTLPNIYLLIAWLMFQMFF